MKFVGTFRFC